MSEAYWIYSCGEGEPALLSRNGIRREWIEEAHWLAPLPASPNKDVATRFYWPIEPPHDHALLHLLGQALVSGERNLLLIGQGEAETALLAGPNAIGRYNLNPKARLTARFTHAGADFTGWLAALPTRLEPFEVDPAGIAWLAVDRHPGQQTAFPQAGWLENPEHLLRRMNELVNRLAQHRAQAGLLFSLPQHGPWLATLVERI